MSPKVDPRRKRTAIMNFRTTPMVARYIKNRSAQMSENVSDFIRESIKMRIEIERTYADVTEALGYKSTTTMVWHAVQEYALRHGTGTIDMPNLPEDGDDDEEQG